MSEIVGGFVVPHVPFILGGPDMPPEEVQEAVRGAFEDTARRLAALEPTAVIVVGTDHYVLYGPRCLPQLVIGTGDVDGPMERLPGIDRGPLPTNEDLAEHLRAHTTGQGFDWAVARSMSVDHSVMIPYHLVVRPAGSIPVVPIYMACGVEPLITMRRAADVGAALAAAVRAYPGSERVAVIGSGGISHSVGTDRMGEVNETFDSHILDLLVRGALEELTAFSDDELLDAGGNGALEVRTFACALAAVGGQAETIAYVPSPDWLTGLGFSQLSVPEEIRS